MHTLCQDLAAIWRRTIPLAAAMGVEIEAFDADELVVRAALAPNVNLHGTAFAGSLYSICALTGWGLLWLELRARGLDPGIVLAKASIGYRRAVAEAITCRCHFDAAAQAPQVERLLDTGRSSFVLECAVAAGGRRAVRFDGEYAVKL